jgi:hypothetical protein
MDLFSLYSFTHSNYIAGNMTLNLIGNYDFDLVGNFYKFAVMKTRHYISRFLSPIERLVEFPSSAGIFYFVENRCPSDL